MTPENPTPKKRRSAYVSNEKALLNYDAIFTNVSTQPVIQNELAEYGYDAAKIAEGKTLADAARKKHFTPCKKSFTPCKKHSTS